MRWIVLVIALAGCARHVPPGASTAALYRDLERLVMVEDTAGWEIDRLEVEGLLASALGSVCRVHPVERRALLEWLDVEIARHGGPVEAAWQRAGKRMSRIQTLVRLTRIRKVLAHADQHADADCPFWIEPTDHFAGRQISDDRWTLSGGGGGKAIGVVQGDRADLEFGGAGRLLLGYTFGSRSGLYAGLEIGASASFPKDEATGTRGQLVVAVDVVTPIVYRHTFINSYLEVEAGWLGHTTEEAPEQIDPGMHVGVAFGGRATRTRFFFPGAAFGINYDRTFAGDGADLHMVKIGLRVAFDVDFE